MEYLDNTGRQRLGDALKDAIGNDARLSIIASYFTVFAYGELKDELSKVKELRFIFDQPTFAKRMEAEKEPREWEIRRRERELGVAGTGLELTLSNNVNQRALARECAEWCRERVRFRTARQAGMIATSGSYHVANPGGQDEAFMGSAANAFTLEGLGYERSKQVYDTLEAEGLVEDKGKKKGAIRPELKATAERGEVPLPPELAGDKAVAEQVCAIVLHKAEKLQIRDKKKEVEVELEKDVSLDPAFQALWERIRQTTRYEMHVDTGELVERAVDGIRQMPRVRPMEVLSTSAGLDVRESGVAADEESVRTSLVRTDAARVYDLPDPLSELADAVGLTRTTLARILEESGRMDEFAVDPMTFLSQVTGKIEAAKNQVVAKGIKYTRLPEKDWYTMDILAVGDLRAYLDQNAWKPLHHKSLYNYVVYDSSSIEQPYAVALDRSEQVKVFAKLPSKFKIDTPLGSYNPDWAYVEEAGDGKQRVASSAARTAPPRRPRSAARRRTSRRWSWAATSTTRWKRSTTTQRCRTEKEGSDG